MNPMSLRSAIEHQIQSVDAQMPVSIVFFFDHTAPTEISTPLYTLSLHDALPISGLKPSWGRISCEGIVPLSPAFDCAGPLGRSEEHTSELQSHSGTSYAVFC